MRFIGIFLCLMINLNCVFGQLRNNIWCFGDSAGIDFNQSVPASIATNLDSRGSCVSIADSSGNLLFYAGTGEGNALERTKVRSANGDLLLNGDSIIGRAWYNELCIIPYPGNSSKYYLFSVGVTSIYGLYYSIIDMSANSGLGEVIEKNIQVDSLAAWDILTSIKHANGRDWWLIMKINGSNYDDSLVEYLITPTGLFKNVQSIGAIVEGNSGNIVFSKDGDKLLFTTYGGVIQFFDFDRCTGLFSNPRVIFNPTNGVWGITGSAFSSNGNVIYYATSDANSYLIQLDLTASNIWASRDTLVSLDHPFEAAGSLRLAPDNKIYWSCAWTNGIVFNYPYQDTMYHVENTYLSVINDPDILGNGSNVSMYSFYLGGKRCYWGLPNNPDYDLGPLSGSICDSLTNGIDENENTFIHIYPNPVGNSASVSIESEQVVSVEAINTLSQKFQLSFEKMITKLEINTSNLPAGLYNLHIKAIKKEFIVKFIKM